MVHRERSGGILIDGVLTVRPRPLPRPHRRLVRPGQFGPTRRHDDLLDRSQ